MTLGLVDAPPAVEAETKGTGGGEKKACGFNHKPCIEVGCMFWVSTEVQLGKDGPRQVAFTCAVLATLEATSMLVNNTAAAAHNIVVVAQATSKMAESAIPRLGK